ncbi:MAG: nicotinate-nucleotide pyrophosphorylase [Thermomicrobiales bacterium]|nr:nicotinate-nucleotide pyrophosphorylase [Thermomicrobiales bacterium]
MTDRLTDLPTSYGIRALIDLALAEDIGGGDITSTLTVAAGRRARGRLLAKAAGVVSGLEVAGEVFRRVDPTIVFTPLVADGDAVAAMTPIATVEGPARSVLAGERVALNLLQRLSGVATLTARYVDAVRETKARIVDTRKTTPGMRALEKAAVRHGGGHNHRFGLTDGVLIKDNHLAAVGGADRVARAVRLARQGAPHTLRIEIELTTLNELAQALEASADIVLLDNMEIADLRKAVAMTADRALLEASGGVTLESVAEIAATGVNLISVGALTHSAPALDISLDLELSKTRHNESPHELNSQ